MFPIYLFVNIWFPVSSTAGVFLTYACLLSRNKRIFALHVLNTKIYYKNCSSRSSNSTVYYSVVVLVVEVLVVYLFINGDISK